jgi:hypothetical protein
MDWTTTAMKQLTKMMMIALAGSAIATPIATTEMRATVPSGVT